MTSWANIDLSFGVGSRPIKDMQDLTLAELLLANRLPPSLFQAYLVDRDQSKTAIPITTTAASVPSSDRVVLQCIRNTDIDSVWASQIDTIQRDEHPVAAMFDVQYGRPQVLNRAYLVDDATLREVISAKITTFCRENRIAAPLVAGISGGGDSNTLVRGIRRYADEDQIAGNDVLCFTLVMDPIWPESAADRARQLCAEVGFQHRVMYPAQVADLLGMTGDPATLWSDFSGRYGPDTSHFFGTWLVNLVGRALCDELSGRHLLLGYNREDVLAELFFCLVNGRRPLPFPVRQVGPISCVLPVWDVSKNLLDGCYPSYSERNYAERDDLTTTQRSSIYLLAHCLDALAPQVSMSLLSGVRALMDDIDGWQELIPVPGTPLMHTGVGDDDAQQRVLDLLRNFFPEWAWPARTKGSGAGSQ